MAGKFWHTLSNGKRVRTAAGIKHELNKFQSSTKAKKERAARNKARRHAIADGEAHKGDGTAVHHIDSNPTHNGAANLRVESAEKNAGEHEDSRLKGSKRNKASWGQD